MTTPLQPSQPLPESLGGAYVPLMAAPDAAADDIRRQLALAQWESRTGAALLEVLTRVEICERLDVACQTLVDQLQQFLKCQRVGLAVCRKGALDLECLVISGSAPIDRNSEHVRRWEAVLCEAAMRGTVNFYPAADTGAAAPLLAHRQLLQHDKIAWIVSSALNLPDGTLVATWLFTGQADQDMGSAVLNFARAAATSVATSLHLVRRAQRSRWAHGIARLWAQPRWRLFALLMLVLLLTAAILIPTPYRIRAHSRVEPVLRRTVCAPFEGVLEKSLVEPGDVVDSEQVLARMDDRTIRLEVLALDAERQRADIQRSSAVARHELGAARMAELEVARLDLRRQLHAERREQLDIKSPLGGIVLQGDQKRAEGAPVSLGQKLFEIAPLETMVFEIAIPESEFAHAAIGQPVVVQLDAYPGRSWRGQLAKIHPRSERWDADWVFVAEFRAANPDRLLRPGMNGKATITGARHPWIWNVGHKAWQNVAAIFGL